MPIPSSSFGSKEDAQKYLSFLKPLAAAVKAEEPKITYNIRPFVTGLSVMLFERFVDQAAHDAQHATSQAHEYIKALNAWNAFTGAMLGKVHKDWYETHQGVIGRAASVIV